MAKSKTVKKIKGKPKSRSPEGPNNDVYRSIRFKSDVKTLIVRTEVGYDMIFDINPQIRVNPYDESENGTPKFQSSLIWTLRGVRPRGTAMKQGEIEATVKDRSMLPMDIDWDVAQLGFVYSTSRDPNNHRWWLEALKSGQKMGEFDSLLSEYTLGVTSTAPMGTRSWFDGIHHGRFIFPKDSIKDAKEISKGHVFIEGNGKGRLGDIESNVDIPQTCIALRLRFDIRKNIWYSEFIDSTGTQVGDTIISTGLKSDAKFKGHIMIDPANQGRPKVSGMIMRDNIISMNTNSDLTMIKGTV
jgi:hypothetical protein|tara:strand:+ start:141 stop:1040 length:900 start_codon:yes stop_codon:yes gene_type:complete